VPSSSRGLYTLPLCWIFQITFIQSRVAKDSNVAKERLSISQVFVSISLTKGAIIESVKKVLQAVLVVP